MIGEKSLLVEKEEFFLLFGMRDGQVCSNS